MKEKWYSYFIEFPFIYGIAAILDSGVKPMVCQSIDYDITSYVNKCKSILDRLYELYAATIQPELVRSSSNGADEYLSYQTKEDFHIIQWWKNHSSKFIVLARFAKDILTKLASTIASEFSFSVDRRVLDEKRSRLAPQSIK
ncbi:putative AC9 transposase, partial [Bienertia sinuspersici]